MMADKKKDSGKLRKEDLKILKMLESPAAETATEKPSRPPERETVERLIYLLENDDRQKAA